MSEYLHYSQENIQAGLILPRIAQQILKHTENLLFDAFTKDKEE
jgi:hypothetical protein